MKLTLDALLRIMPNAGRERASGFLAPLNDAMLEFSIDTPTRQAAFLAQLAHESGSLRYVRELASGNAYNLRSDLGNTRPEALEAASRAGTTTGAYYRGRGLIQITGYDNYAECSRALFGDTETLTHNPAILEGRELACRSAAWFWRSRGLNDLADAGDFIRITRRINGGLNGISDRLTHYDLARSELKC